MNGRRAAWVSACSLLAIVLLYVGLYLAMLEGVVEEGQAWWPVYRVKRLAPLFGPANAVHRWLHDLKNAAAPQRWEDPAP